VSACRLGIVIIGPGWLAADASGQPRLSSPADIVRREVCGLLAKNRRLLPVLVGGAQLPPPESLPEALRVLSKYQAIALDNSSWEAGLQQIVALIDAEISAPAKARDSAVG